MWNHAQNCSSSYGEEDNGDSKDRIEKSLDLSQYLKYLDQLFSQPTSESDSSDSDEGESRIFNDFLQPPPQPSDRSQLQYSQSSSNVFLGSSSVSGNNHFSALKTSDSLHSHLEANISSSSLSSIDSGTSSLSLNLSAEFYPDVPLEKLDDGVSNENASALKSPNLCTDSSSSSAPDDDKPDEKGTDKNKKSQKKKKTSKGSENIPRQNKPSSGGNGNNGSKGGGSGGPSTSAGNTGDISTGKGEGNSSTNQGGTNSGSSPGAKNRAGKSTSADVTRSNAHNLNKGKIDALNACQSFEDKLSGNLKTSSLSSSDQLMNGDLTDFSCDFLLGRNDAFDTNAMTFSAILDISEDENSLSDYISMPESISSMQLESGITSTINSPVLPISSAINEKKRKADGPLHKGCPEKLAKLSEKQKQSRIEYLNAKRKKIYLYICRKEIGKTQRNRANTFKEGLAMRRKLSQAVERHMRRKAQQDFQKCMKESVCKAKKLTQEMETHWKMVEKSEREFWRLKEKEAEEKHKKDLEILNKQIETQKFQRLVLQVEMFASELLKTERKLTNQGEDPQGEGTVEGSSCVRFDGRESDTETSSVKSIVSRALKDHHNLVKLLDMSGLYSPDTDAIPTKEISQPQMYEGFLESFQIKGINWLKSLYVQGINGILADEVGLGKKVQIVAFLSHLAESCGLWGPFLVVSPTSLMYKWQRMFERFSPRLKLLSFWGKPLEKKTLKQFWEKTNLPHEEACFHVVLTSYNAMVTDLEYFGKIKWQYLVMDDSLGAITSSTKWLSLLSFQCRNKLLLSEGPHLNSSSKIICSYLYFIMPSLFDSHHEFSEWLLKELDSHPKRINEVDEESRSRLQSVVQKFLMCRKKEEVENEAKRTFDVQLLCELTNRQRQIYSALIKTSNLGSLLENLENCKPNELKSRSNELLNLFKQLQKACCHPDLVKRREAKLSFYMHPNSITLPKLILEGPTSDFDVLQRLINRLFCIYNSHHVHNSLFKDVPESCSSVTSFKNSSTWSFSRFLELSCSEIEEAFTKPFSSRLNYLVKLQSVLERVQFESTWKSYGCNRANLVDYYCITLPHRLSQSKVFSNLLFSTLSSTMYEWGSCKIFTAVEHRCLGSRKALSEATSFAISRKVSRMERKIVTCSFEPLEFPAFLSCYTEKVVAGRCEPLVTRSKTKDFSSSCSISQVTHAIRGCGPALGLVVSNMINEIFKLVRMKTQFQEYDQLVRDSGKLKRLDEMLVFFQKKGKRVLLSSHDQNTAELLEDFLTRRKVKFERTRELTCIHPDTSVFLMLSSNAPGVELPVDEVIFFDQDWNESTEGEKTKIVSKLAFPNKTNFYRLISKGTIEEKFMYLKKDGNTASSLKEAFENKNGFGVPLIKNLVSLLTRDATGENEMKERKSPATDPKIDHEGVENSSAPNGVKHLKRQNMKERGHSIYVGFEGADMCSYMDLTDCQGEELCYGFDEGYMGMSPESFDDMSIKSDYEDDSIPSKNKIGRGSGKRGRPPSRARLQRRDLNDESLHRRGPGRPRLKPIGPANQGIRGRKPGRPPLTKKAETISSSISALSSGQRVFGFYNSPDLDLS